MCSSHSHLNASVDHGRVTLPYAVLLLLLQLRFKSFRQKNQFRSRSWKRARTSFTRRRSGFFPYSCARVLENLHLGYAQLHFLVFFSGNASSEPSCVFETVIVLCAAGAACATQINN
jgi:hypothetical protein